MAQGEGEGKGVERASGGIPRKCVGSNDSRASQDLLLHPFQSVRLSLPSLWQNEDVEAVGSTGNNFGGSLGGKI